MGIPSNHYVKVTTPRSSSTTVSGWGGLTPLAAAPDSQAGGVNPPRSTSHFGDWILQKVDFGCRDQSEQIDLEK